MKDIRITKHANVISQSVKIDRIIFKFYVQKLPCSVDSTIMLRKLIF